ncbi:hypothetical protein [Streptomyces venezuelae]|uniref:hypothetical protein n=1 Tax=Streptomyces venezuelae TaxID=54571 RepID=UPI00343B90D6
MTSPSAASGDWTVFLAELHGFLETCDNDVDAALTDHFGFDTAVDWLIAGLELLAEHLREHPEGST